MRISDQQRFTSFTQNVQERLTNLNRIQQEIGTGRSLFDPSDDVERAGQALRTEAQLAENSQFLRNIDDGKAWVSSADGALQSITDLLTQIDALAVATDNDTQTADDRHNTATQIDQKLEQLMSLVNSKHGDRSVFGGHNTTSTPFVAVRDANGKITDATANQTSIQGKIYRRIGQNDDVQINIPGNDLFQPAGSSGSSQDLFYVISSLRDTIGNNNQPPPGFENTLSNQALRDQLSAIRERISAQQTYLGSVGQRLDHTKDRLKEMELTLTATQDRVEGIDMPSLASRLSVEQSTYNALLSINSKLLSQSLVDYIK
jgi:flagellar hook-associated protein 3 FlgL